MTRLRFTVVVVCVAVLAGCGTDARAETVHAGRELRGQIELLRLVVATDRASVPPVPYLSVTIGDAAEDLGSAGTDAAAIPDECVRAALVSIADRAVGVARELDGTVGDGTDQGLDQIDDRLRGLLAELDGWGVRR
ncbi:hypothetical protein ACFWIW_24565 [Amycolatopsis sp. NPDC058340]|uniref:hypothetical protein n=1 Tax=Amycolatopsis sp. NPDC058340 TaxID=3346453 RepID=UPI003647FA63